jgi:hypothetical protein
VLWDEHEVGRKVLLGAQSGQQEAAIVVPVLPALATRQTHPGMIVPAAHTAAPVTVPTPSVSTGHDDPALSAARQVKTRGIRRLHSPLGEASWASWGRLRRKVGHRLGSPRAPPRVHVTPT